MGDGRRMMKDGRRTKKRSEGLIRDRKKVEGKVLCRWDVESGS